MSGSGTLRMARLLGVALFTVIHLGALDLLVAGSLIGQLARGPNGDDVGVPYRETARSIA